MSRLIVCIITIFVFLFLVSFELFADSYRCGRKLIQTGDSSRDVLRICGEPAHKDRGNEKIRLNGADRNTRVERWYYRKSRRSLEHVVLIHQGRVAAIEVVGR
jgi:hypothetical protein